MILNLLKVTKTKTEDQNQKFLKISNQDIWYHVKNLALMF